MWALKTLITKQEASHHIFSVNQKVPLATNQISNANMDVERFGISCGVWHQDIGSSSLGLVDWRWTIINPYILDHTAVWEVVSSDRHLGPLLTIPLSFWVKHPAVGECRVGELGLQWSDVWFESHKKTWAKVSPAQHYIMKRSKASVFSTVLMSWLMWLMCSCSGNTSKSPLRELKL